MRKRQGYEVLVDYIYVGIFEFGVLVTSIMRLI